MFISWIELDENWHSLTANKIQMVRTDDIFMETYIARNFSYLSLIIIIFF